MYKIIVRGNGDIAVASKIFTGKDSSRNLNKWVDEKNCKGHENCEYCNKSDAKLKIHPAKHIENGGTIDWMCKSCYLDAILETDLESI